MTRIPLRNVRLSGGSQPVMLPSATLLLHQEYIPDGLGGRLSGRRSWQIHVPAGLSYALLFSGAQLTFESEKMSGNCFAKGQPHSGRYGTGERDSVTERDPTSATSIKRAARPRKEALVSVSIRSVRVPDSVIVALAITGACSVSSRQILLGIATRFARPEPQPGSLCFVLASAG